MAYDLKALLGILPKDDELAQAQANDEQQAGWDQAQDALRSAFTRTPYQKMDHGPTQAEQLLKQRAGVTGQLQQLDAAGKAQDFAAKHDPNSPVLQKHRELLATLSGGKPEDYANMSASDMEELLPIQKEIIAAEKARKQKSIDTGSATEMRNNAKATYKTEISNINWDNVSDAQLPEMMKQAQAQWAERVKAHEMSEAAIKPLRDLLHTKRPNVDASQMTPEGIRMMLADIEKEEAEKGKNSRLATTSGQRGRALDQKDATIDIRRGAQNFHQAQFNVNGWAPDSADTPPMTMQQKNEVSSQLTAANVVKQHIAEARDIIERNHGSIFNPANKDFTRFTQLLEEMGPQIATAGGYGNYTQAHEKIVRNLVAHPNELVNWFNDGRIATQLDGLEHGVHLSISQRQHDMGFHDKKAGEASGVTQYQTPMRTPEQQRASSGAPAPDAAAGPPAKVGDRKRLKSGALVKWNGKDWEVIEG